MAEHSVEDDINGCNEDTRSKRPIVPAHACSDFCRENHKPLGKPVGNTKLAWSMGMEEDLLPGIINDITLELIIPKLSWRDFYVLRSVSPTWQQAIQSHVVYESRVRSLSTELLAIVAGVSLCSSRDLSLYSLRDDTWSTLPSNPYLPKGVPRCSQCISLDGRLYVIGGIKEYRREFERKIRVGSNKVYILDLVGQRPWQKCADMLEPRLDFGCGVIDGKIYVFGGASHDKPVFGSEVYDPKANTWSPIKPMISSRVDHYVFKLGHELFVHGGWDSTTTPLFWGRQASGLEAYDPLKDEWRLISRQTFGLLVDRKIFTAQGFNNAMIYMELCDIDILQAWRRLGTPGQSFMCRMDEDFKSFFLPISSIIVDNEVLGISGGELKSTGCRVHRLVRSRGFGNGKEDIVWEFCTGPSSLWDPVSMCGIEI